MNIPRAARFLSELEPTNQLKDDALDDLGADLLDRSGFESEMPDQGFDDRE